MIIDFYGHPLIFMVLARPGLAESLLFLTFSGAGPVAIGSRLIFGGFPWIFIDFQGFAGFSSILMDLP